MSGADIIVAAPWIAFGIALLGLCISPLLSRRASRRRSAHSRGDDENARSGGEEMITSAREGGKSA